MEIPAQAERERTHSSSAFLFHLGPQWIGRCPPTLLSLSSQMTPPEITLDQLSGHPLAQSRWHSHINLTITEPIDAVQTNQLWGAEQVGEGPECSWRGRQRLPALKETAALVRPCSKHWGLSSEEDSQALAHRKLTV